MLSYALSANVSVRESDIDLCKSAGRLMMPLRGCAVDSAVSATDCLAVQPPPATAAAAAARRLPTSSAYNYIP